MEEHRRNRQNRYGRILCGLVFLALCGTIFCMGVNAREARQEARKAEAVKEVEAEKKKAEKEEKKKCWIYAGELRLIRRSPSLPSA